MFALFPNMMREKGTCRVICSLTRAKKRKTLFFGLILVRKEGTLPRGVWDVCLFLLERVKAKAPPPRSQRDEHQPANIAVAVQRQ